MWYVSDIGYLVICTQVSTGPEEVGNYLLDLYQTRRRQGFPTKYDNITTHQLSFQMSHQPAKQYDKISGVKIHVSRTYSICICISATILSFREPACQSCSLLEETSSAFSIVTGRAGICTLVHSNVSDCRGILAGHVSDSGREHTHKWFYP